MMVVKAHDIEFNVEELWIESIKLAVEDFYNEEDDYEASTWLFSDELLDNSFLTVCSALGVDYKKIRFMLLLCSTHYEFLKKVQWEVYNGKIGKQG